MKNENHEYVVGPLTMKYIFEKAGLTDISNLQAVLDQAESSFGVLETEQDQSKVNRVEVIDHGDHDLFPMNRVYMNYNCHDVSVVVQDEGCTVKIFLKTQKDEV
jgi:hypothetical protein